MVILKVFQCGLCVSQKRRAWKDIPYTAKIRGNIGFISDLFVYDFVRGSAAMTSHRFSEPLPTRMFQQLWRRKSDVCLFKDRNS